MDKKGKPMKIYIAGKITGEPRYKEKFKAEETRLQKWIPCSVRLPENGENVLVWDKLSGDAFTGCYYESDGWEIDGYYGDYSWDISHWMPRPEPPEEGERQDEP